MDGWTCLSDVVRMAVRIFCLPFEGKSIHVPAYHHLVEWTGHQTLLQAHHMALTNVLGGLPVEQGSSCRPAVVEQFESCA